MAELAAETETFGDRYHFLIRRLHSLTGIVPIGAFLCVHLSVNATIIAGPEAFQYAVDQIHNIGKLGILKPVEVAFIFTPIAFHAILGVVIWLQGRRNLAAYQYGGNLRYTLQRVTGLIAFAFILGHLWHLHWIIPGGEHFDPHAAAETTVKAMQAGWTAPVYAIGVICSVYHLANGAWTFLITWGITISPKSQKLSGAVCATLGISLMLLGIGALITLKGMDVSEQTPESAASHAAALHYQEDWLG